MSDESPDDDALLAALRSGDAAAARAVYERHGAAVLRFARAMTRTRALAEDIVHDTFVQVLTRPDRFDSERGPLIAYLLGIARIRVRRELKEASAPNGASDGPAEDGAVASLEDTAAHAEVIDRVRSAILALPMRHREVITLCDLQELPYAIVADVLDCPVGTVRSRLHRARALLAIRLTASGLAPGGQLQCMPN
jgi:RNA polymerase sigma factor (sigma-70 family)